MSKQIKLDATKQTMQRSSLQPKMSNSDDEFYALYEENGLKIGNQDIQRDYHVKIFESTRMQHPTIDSTYQNIYQQTYPHNEMVDSKDNINYFGVFTINENDNHPT